MRFPHNNLFISFALIIFIPMTVSADIEQKALGIEIDWPFDSIECQHEDILPKYNKQYKKFIKRLKRNSRAKPKNIALPRTISPGSYTQVLFNGEDAQALGKIKFVNITSTVDENFIDDNLEHYVLIDFRNVNSRGKNKARKEVELDIGRTLDILGDVLVVRGRERFNGVVNITNTGDSTACIAMIIEGLKVDGEGGQGVTPPGGFSF